MLIIDIQCPEGEAYSNCGANECQNTCSDFMKMMNCTAACTPGCVCVLGYVRDENGVCIPAETCGGIFIKIFYVIRRC